MENLFFLLATSLVFRKARRKNRKYVTIGNTGCSALMVPPSGAIDHVPTRTGDELYFHQFTEKNVRYGLICVRMPEQFELDAATEMLQVYMNKLRGPFFILHQTGAVADVTWNNEGAHALVDYWQDCERQDWKVKGYTDGRCMAVLFVKNIAAADVMKQEHFLDSFHFPSYIS